MTVRLEKLMLNFTKFTHYLPNAWAHRVGLFNNPNQLNRPLSTWEKSVIVDAFVFSKEEIVKNFYVPRIQSLVEEIIGLLCTPVILLIYLPR